MKKLSRRMVLRGVGGVALTLPLLESFAPRKVRAGASDVPPFAIFFRQANGVAAAQDTNEIGAEPERFWPRDLGALTSTNVADRALDELEAHLQSLLVVRNINMKNFDYGDGHARGALQGLTARGPVVPSAAGDSEAAGESIDHRIGRELNPDGRDSMFLYAGKNSGWLGGACISYRAAEQRRAPLHNPVLAYQQMMGVDSDQFEQLVARQQSVNDLVRDQMQALMSRPELSSSDKRRLQLHFEAIRDLENNLSCNLKTDEEAQLEGDAAGYDSDDGDLVLAAARAHMDVAALAVSCGYTRSVAIQMGNGNDGITRFRDPDTGELMENYHYISHRRLSHDANGDIIPDSDVLHHKIDRYFAQTFRHLIERLEGYMTPNGDKLLDSGVCVWYNDNSNGPAHSSRNIPYILAGSAGGFFKRGQYIEVGGGEFEENHARMLNTIGSAVGLRNGDGDYLDEFGDPELPKGILPELLT